MLQSFLIFALILCQTCNSESLGYALPRSMAASSTPCSLNMTYEVEMPDGVKVRYCVAYFPALLSPVCAAFDARRPVPSATMPLAPTANTLRQNKPCTARMRSAATARLQRHFPGREGHTRKRGKLFNVFARWKRWTRHHGVDCAAELALGRHRD